MASSVIVPLPPERLLLSKGDVEGAARASNARLALQTGLSYIPGLTGTFFKTLLRR